MNDLITTGASLLVSKQLLGKTADLISEDISKLYAKGRDKIISFASRKIKNTNDGLDANLRVTRDVFFNGSFTDESVCAEYFGGILASSRSKDGKDDSGIFYVDLIKSLSSQQLKLHYSIYRALNVLLVRDESKKSLNCGSQSELGTLHFYLSTLELQDLFGKERFASDLFAINNKGLINQFICEHLPFKEDKTLPYTEIIPSPLGIQLLAVANNKYDSWRKFSYEDLGDFKDIELPEYYSLDINSLKQTLSNIS